MVLFDPHRYAYPSRRSVVYARRAMACTSVPLGAQVGLDVMKAGGNAVDAAVAMAAAMPLLEPTGNGIGGDCFALVWVEREKKLYGLNASGVSPAALSAALVRERGFGEMPKEGWLPTMVPGAPGGWAELNRRFGTRPLEEGTGRPPYRPGYGAGPGPPPPLVGADDEGGRHPIPGGRDLPLAGVR